MLCVLMGQGGPCYRSSLCNVQSNRYSSNFLMADREGTPVQDCVGDGLSLFALALDEAPVLAGVEFIRA